MGIEKMREESKGETERDGKVWKNGIQKKKRMEGNGRKGAIGKKVQLYQKVKQLKLSTTPNPFLST